MATPSPVDTLGLVVLGNSCPAPPDASSVQHDRKRVLTPVERCTISAPMHFVPPTARGVHWFALELNLSNFRTHS